MVDYATTSCASPFPFDRTCLIVIDLINAYTFNPAANRSLGFSSECLGQHSGTGQAANLGDGNGYSTYPQYSHPVTSISRIGISQENETAVIRWDYGDPELGTCKETIQGGNHFRYWVQDGPQGNTYVYLSPYSPALVHRGFLARNAHTRRNDNNSGAIFMAVSYEMPIARMWITSSSFGLYQTRSHFIDRAT